MFVGMAPTTRLLIPIVLCCYVAETSGASGYWLTHKHCTRAVLELFPRVGLLIKSVGNTPSFPLKITASETLPSEHTKSTIPSPLGPQSVNWMATGKGHLFSQRSFPVLTWLRAKPLCICLWPLSVLICIICVWWPRHKQLRINPENWYVLFPIWLSPVMVRGTGEPTAACNVAAEVRV